MLVAMPCVAKKNNKRYCASHKIFKIEPVELCGCVASLLTKNNYNNQPM